MAIYLTTGKPGSFKSASTIEKALKIQTEGRVVYFCNFRGLKADEYQLNTIEHFKDWVLVPDGAVLFVDEVQEFTRDVPTNAKTEDLPDWFTQLEKHRHRGIDIYVNTQHPMFIHTHLRRLLEKHWHLQRTQGLPFANLRMWQQVCNEPEDIRNTSIKMGCTTSIYKPNKDVFKYYESTVLDTHRFVIPPKLIKYGLLILLGLFVSVYLFSGFIYKFLPSDNKQQSHSEQQSNQSLAQGVKVLSDEEVKQLSYVQSLEKELNELREEQYKNQLIEYNPNDPFKPMEYTYRADIQPVLSGCAMFANKCSCYTQQATKLDVSDADCKRYMSGDKPFNPFLQVSTSEQNHILSENFTH